MSPHPGLFLPGSAKHFHHGPIESDGKLPFTEQMRSERGDLGAGEASQMATKFAGESGKIYTFHV